MKDAESRSIYLRGPSLGLRYFVLASIAVGMMVVDHREQHLATVRGWLNVAAYPLQWLASAPGSAIDTINETTASRARLESDRVRLEAENLQLKLRLQRYEALEAENRRLRESRDVASRIVKRSMVADVLRVDLDRFRQRVLVSRGTRDGVTRGQAAVSGQGVFGQVVRVGPLTSELIMISDSEHSLPVMAARSGFRTIAVGTGDPGRLALPYLPKNADLQDGDLLVTSGLGGVYPPGYPVAKVVDVRRESSESLLIASAVPITPLDRVTEVLLVWFDPAIAEPDPEPTITELVQQAGPLPAPPPPAASAPATPAVAPTTGTTTAQQSTPAPANPTPAPVRTDEQTARTAAPATAPSASPPSGGNTAPGEPNR